jgi:hypothetical protein
VEAIKDTIEKFLVVDSMPTSDNKKALSISTRSQYDTLNSGFGGRISGPVRPELWAQNCQKYTMSNLL